MSNVIKLPVKRVTESVPDEFDMLHIHEDINEYANNIRERWLRKINKISKINNEVKNLVNEKDKSDKK